PSTARPRASTSPPRRQSACTRPPGPSVSRCRWRHDPRDSFASLLAPIERSLGFAMSYVKLPVFDKSGYVMLDPYDQSRDPAEWLDIEYVDWKSSGETRFAPLASAYGELE